MMGVGSLFALATECMQDTVFLPPSCPGDVASMVTGAVAFPSAEVGTNVPEAKAPLTLGISRCLVLSPSLCCRKEKGHL